MRPTSILVMGVSGSGKTSIGRALAGELDWDFIDADDFHPPGNIAKMATGIPLTDEDRFPWLALLHDRLVSTLKASRHPILACSALKEKYRHQLLDGLDGALVVYLKGSYALIDERMSHREDHYMKPGMLQSQFDALEEPADALVMDVALPVDEIVLRVLHHGFINTAQERI